MQNDVGNQYAATTIIAAMTTTLRPYPVTVVVAPPEGGLAAPLMVNCAQLLTIDKSRLLQRLGALTCGPMYALMTSSVMLSLLRQK